MKHPAPLIAVLSALAAAACAQEIDLYVTDYTGRQDIGEEQPLGRRKTGTVSIFAAQGEYEPFGFALQPHDRLPDVMIRSGALAGPAGVIPAGNIRIASIEEFNGERCLLMDLGRPWDMAAWSKELFWVTVHVPDHAKAGTYEGNVEVSSAGKSVATLKVRLEVLPFRLEDPPMAIGWHFSRPTGGVEALRAQLRDMREHGMTNVGPLYNWHLPVHDDDTSQIGMFIAEYLGAGFREPIMFAAPMELTVGGLTGYGPVDSKRFQQKYIEVMRKLWAEVRKHNHPVIFSIGDEFTNKGMAGVEFAGKLAKLAYEELPEIPVTSDCNGYMEIMAMAPWMHFATFNNGWDGADRHNRGRRLINDKFIEELRAKTDAIPYLVNAGKGRFPFGFFLWRMSKWGVRGKVEWYYCLADNERGSVVRTQGSEVWPTIAYETSREGIDDLKYLTRLERLIATANASGTARAETAAAEACLKKLLDTIVPNWTAYSAGGQKWPVDGMEEVSAERAVAIGSLNAIRREIVDRIVALHRAMD